MKIQRTLVNFPRKQAPLTPTHIHFSKTCTEPSLKVYIRIVFNKTVTIFVMSLTFFRGVWFSLQEIGKCRLVQGQVNKVGGSSPHCALSGSSSPTRQAQQRHCHSRGTNSKFQPYSQNRLHLPLQHLSAKFNKHCLSFRHRFLVYQCITCCLSKQVQHHSDPQFLKIFWRLRCFCSPLHALMFCFRIILKRKNLSPCHL